MTERCRCGRYVPGDRAHDATLPDVCFRDVDQTDRYVCDQRTEAREMGLREGVELAKKIARRGYPVAPYAMGDFVVNRADYAGPERLGIFWDDVDAELKRMEGER